MFADLDQIDWEGIGSHVYGRHKEIPEAIRSLVSRDARVREEVRSFLLGEGQDFGDIYDTTPYIIPFIFEILGSPNGPGKADLLDHLSSVARHICEAERLPVHQMRLYVRTYDVLKAGLPCLVALLGDNATDIRLAAIDLLQYLKDEVETLFPEFKQHFYSEKEEVVQVALLGGLKTLLSPTGWRGISFEQKEQYKPFLNEIVETNPSLRIQIAAAQASAEVFEKHLTRGLSPKIGDILSNHFWETSKAINYQGWSEEFDAAMLIVKDLARLEAADHLIQMLQNPEITPVQAHLIARGLLAVFMIYHDNVYWNCRRNYYAKGKELDYVHSQPEARTIEIYVSNRNTFEQRFLRLIDAIVENQQFWELPTNMLSFFTGLPDSREELRILLKSQPGQ